MKNILQRSSLILLALFAAACAYSPQRITIQPVLSVEGEAYGNGRPIIVSATDQRENRVLGSIGGVYGNSATITIANDLEQALSRAANGLLASKGFVVNSPDASAVQLNIVVENISYQPQDTQVGTSVKLSATLRAEATRGGETFTGSYRTETERKSVTKPDAEHNEKWFNELLQATLARMFDDPKLRQFLLQ
jgi:uncharacterized lipoprotein